MMCMRHVGAVLLMNYFDEVMVGTEIHSIYVDSEITYIMLTNGTQLTVRGLLIVQPAPLAVARPSDARITKHSHRLRD